MYIHTYVHTYIKTHNSELRGQEETAIITQNKKCGELFTRKSIQKITTNLLKPP